MPTTVITGSASGIGAATREMLLATGHRVIGIDLHDADIVADLSHSAGRAHAVSAALAACGDTLDHLVCCAGLGQNSEPEKIVAVNYFGTKSMLDGLFAALQKGRSPSVVVIVSVAAVSIGFGIHPLQEALLSDNEAEALRLCGAAGDVDSLLVYAASKQALVCDVRRRAMDWGHSGVRINAVAPGPIDTPLLRACAADPRFKDIIGGFVPPLARSGRAQEVADLVAFLISEKADFIHGSVQFIDGGTDAMMRPMQFGLSCLPPASGK